MKYQIESKINGQWDASHVGAAEGNVFDTETEAMEAIEDLRGLGPEWAEAEYRVVPIA